MTESITALVSIAGSYCLGKC